VSTDPTTTSTAPAPRVLRVPRRPMPPAPRAIVRTLGRFPVVALAVALAIVVASIGWLWWEQQQAAQDSRDRDVAIGGLVGDVNALRTEVADRGGNPDTIAPAPAERLESAGVTAIPGPAGPAGSPGAPGAPGVSGSSGAAGQPGAAGGQGQQGPAGPQGSPGPSGAAGSPGASGAAGANGQPGAEGSPGSPGAAGGAGSAGPAGPQGEAGPAGASGAAGAPGRGVVTVECTGEGASSVWVVTYSDGTTSSAGGPCRLAAATSDPPSDPGTEPGTDPVGPDVPSGEPTTTP